MNSSTVGRTKTELREELGELGIEGKLEEGGALP